MVSHKCIPTGPGQNAERFSKGPNYSLQLGSPTSLWCAQPAVRPATPGTAVDVGPCTGGGKQRWHWDTADRIVHTTSGLCITVPHGTCEEQHAARPGHLQRHREAGVGRVGPAPAARRGERRASARSASCAWPTPERRRQPGTTIALAGCDLSAGQMFTYTGRRMRVAGGCVALAGTARSPGRRAPPRRRRPGCGARTTASTTRRPNSAWTTRTRARRRVRTCRYGPATEPARSAGSCRRPISPRRRTGWTRPRCRRAAR